MMFGPARDGLGLSSTQSKPGLLLIGPKFQLEPCPMPAGPTHEQPNLMLESKEAQLGPNLLPDKTKNITSATEN